MGDKHTPTVNLVGDRFDTEAAEILNTLPTQLPDHEAANLADTIAHAIRTAVNHHDELVKALKVALTALDNAGAEVMPGAPPEEIDCWILSPIAYASAISYVRDALAKVEASDA